MEPLPKGANFMRCKMLWEIGLHIAGDPATPYYGNRDMCIAVGKGSGDAFRRRCAWRPARPTSRMRWSGTSSTLPWSIPRAC